MTLHRALIASAICMIFTTSQAWGHALWDPSGALKPRPNANGSYPDDLKTGPCGGLPRTENPAILEAGATFTVQFKATVFHQGYFRIAFSPANDQGFDDYVLLDNIMDIQGQGQRSVDITLPSSECTDCTLQLIQVMLDRTPASNYYSCTDIQLVTSAAAVKPQPVTAFTATAENQTVSLRWNLPPNDNILGVLVMESRTAQNPLPIDGQPYNLGEQLGDGEVVSLVLTDAVSLNDRNVSSSQPYFYDIYTFDEAYRYSSPTSQQVEFDSVPTSSGGAMPLSLLFLFCIIGLVRTNAAQECAAKIRSVSV